MDLEISQDERFQTHEWRVERIGWVLMGLFVLGGLLGLLGTGPFSWDTSRSSLGLVDVDYQRVTHNEADDSVTFRFAPAAVDGGTITVELTGSWVAGVDRQGIMPQPANENAIPDGVGLEIPAQPSGDTTLTITFRAQGYGPLTGNVAVKGDRASFTQFVLP